MRPLSPLIVLTFLVLAGCSQPSGPTTTVTETVTTTSSSTATASTTTTGDSAEAPVTHFADGALLLGDGALSTAPEVGSIYSCQSSFNGGGADKDGAWIQGDRWYPEQKAVTVDGSVSWDSAFQAVVQASERDITGNSLPDHPTGHYPISSSDDAYEYDRNPNRIQEHDVDLAIPADPQIVDSPTCLGLGAIGIMQSGAYFFNGLDGAGRDAAAHEIQDTCHGHPEMDGTYHYHDLSPCLADPGSGHSDLLGYALDGFGIYGERGEDGQVLHDEDLGACHGHNHAIDWDGQTRPMFHYHATPEYPYTLGCFVGTPVQSAVGVPSGSGPPPGGPPPQ